LLELSDSPDFGKGRDRDFPKNMTPVSMRKHLPSPGLGEVTGHGLSYEKFKEKKYLDDIDDEGNDWDREWR
jgi:hypothetical protein